jgi:hypothetical protein
MSDDLHPHIAGLARKYGRDLAQVSPSPSLDARIDHLVASPPRVMAQRPRRQWRRPFAWAAAACFSVLAISAGIIIGIRLERSRDAASMPRGMSQHIDMAPGDLGMWPSDSVALTIPAEYSAQGTLVAVDPHDKSTGKRYLIDVVVSNNGTMRIERIIPADGNLDQEKVDQDGITLQAQ